MSPTSPLPSALAARLAHVAERHGLRKVASLIGVSHQTIGRAAAGHGVYCGNRVLIEKMLPAVEALQVEPRTPKG